MPVQQQMSSFVKKLGGRVAQANAEHVAKPVDTGTRRLPGGIRDGIARLSSMYTKEQTDDNSKTPKGETFFRASAVVLSPAEHNGEKVAGMVTSVVIPLCDVPEKGQRRAVTFSENWYDFQNLFKLLGAPPFPEPPVKAPPDSPEAIAQSQRIEDYYFGMVRTLTDPERMKTHPIYISFSTRGWTPPPTAQQPKPEEMVFETWHGLAKWDGPPDPAAGVTTVPPSQPIPTSLPPTYSPSTNGVPQQPAGASSQPDPADVVAALVEVAMDDPEGAGEEGQDAARRLEKMAWDNGWTTEQTVNAADWSEVGKMALTPPTAPGMGTQATTSVPPPATADSLAAAIPAPGSRWLFAKRTKEGAKLKNSKGEEFPPQEVEVATVDLGARTCTVRTVKDGKDVVDIRSKTPVTVKFEWLERLPY